MNILSKNLKITFQMVSSRKCLSKKELCYLFGLVSPSGETLYYKKLKKDYFSDKALADLNMTEEEYTAFRNFDWPTTKKLLVYLDINEEDRA